MLGIVGSGCSFPSWQSLNELASALQEETEILTELGYTEM